MLQNLARVPLGHWPTPIHELPRLSRALGGPRILVKRDDLTGLAMGGNKTRKLECLLADALAQGATTLITPGAVQSNHARQTAAAAAHAGLRCVLVLRAMAPAEVNGNLLLDNLLGAQVRWTGDRDPYDLMQEIAREEVAAGRKPYVIPMGGSNPIGASAYALAMDETVRQLIHADLRVDHIVLASSTGGTQAGLLVGARARGFRGTILGISVGPSAESLKSAVLELAQATAAYLELAIDISPEQIAVDDHYVGQGYAVLGAPEQEAIRLAAQTEGLLLDPVYTGRAMAGLIDLIRQKRFGRDETVLFWHTGGAPALFAYAGQLLRS